MTTSQVDPRARPVVRTLGGYRPGTPIEEVQRRFKLRSVIKLASNENALGPSPKAVAALRGLGASLHRYPDAACRQLRRRLAAHLKVTPESVAVGNGSDELLVLALRAFVEPGNDVVVADPTFLIYALQTQAVGARVVSVPLKRLRYDLDAMRRAVTPRTKLIFIANPDNPTGSYVTAKEFERFLQALPPTVVVVSDEAYYEFVPARDYPQTVRWIERFPLLVTRSFSKAYGLAGLRVGYGIARPSIIRALDAVREPFNVNSLAQAAACAALDDRAFLKKTQRLAAASRRQLVPALERFGWRVVPSVTNFVLVEIGPNASDVADALLRRGVIVREMSAWKLPGFIRITFGTPAEHRRLLTELKRIVKGRAPTALDIPRPASSGTLQR